MKIKTKRPQDTNWQFVIHATFKTLTNGNKQVDDYFLAREESKAHDFKALEGRALVARLGKIRMVEFYE